MERKLKLLCSSLFLSLCFLLIHETGKTQNQPSSKTVQGKVSGQSGDSLSGTTVTVKGTTNVTTTDATGRYTLLNVPDDAILVFTNSGYAPLEIPVSGRTAIDAVLQTQATSLDDVVVVGYGTQSRRNVTSSIATVKSDKLVVAPVASVANAVVGRLPGLVAKQTSGQPGSDAANLSIRGFGPSLVIVDGIESSLNNIDASQIESFSILKDGAASIYGSRAGNGVILITTKRGTSGKPVVSLTSTYSLQGVTAMMKPATSPQLTEIQREIWVQNGSVGTAPWSQAQVDSFRLFQDGSNPAYPNTNWFDLAFRDWAPQHQHNLSVRGGSDKIKYFGVVGYTDQETMVRKNGGGYKRYNAQANIDASITKDLTMRFDFMGAYEDRLFPRRGIGTSAGFESDAWQDLYTSRPYFLATFPDPTKLSAANDVGNVIASTDVDISGYYSTITKDYRAALTLDYKIPFVKGLSAVAFVNYRDQSNLLKTFTKSGTFHTYNPSNNTYAVALPGAKANLLQQYITSPMVTQNYSLNYRNSFGEHQVSGVALYESINYRSDNFAAFRQNFLTPTIDQLFNGSTTGATANGSASEMGRKSYVFRANYSYRNKYLLEGILRADASAKFFAENQWGYFPSVSAGWVITQEGFMQNIRSLDNLKLRASYGRLGNDAIGNFQYLAGYNIGSFYAFNSVSQQGLVSRGIAQTNFSWEEVALSNIGLDFSLFKRKLYGTAEAFYRKRSGILGTRANSIPSTFGATLPTENLNTQSDRGFELSLGTTGRKGEFSYDVSANISWSRAKWDYYDEAAYTDPDQKWVNQRTGQWQDRAFGLLADGLFTSQEEVQKLTYTSVYGVATSTLRPGDVRYKDVNSDGVIDDRDRVEIGKGIVPHWLSGMNVDLRYKNFDLSALLQGAFGYSTYVNLRGRYGGIFSERLWEVRWTEKNNDPAALIPRLAGPNAGNNRLLSDYYMKDAAYVRLKVFALGYTLPRNWLNIAHISQFRVYVSGTNMLTWNKLRKFQVDPEAPTELGTGDILRYYPQQRVISFGLNASF